MLIFVHRREIIFQTRDQLAEFGVNAGVILAGEPLNQMAGVQVASVQTLWSRCIRARAICRTPISSSSTRPTTARARTYRQIIESYPDAAIIGGTATPCRKDGRGLARPSCWSKAAGRRADRSAFWSGPGFSRRRRPTFRAFIFGRAIMSRATCASA